MDGHGRKSAAAPGSTAAQGVAADSLLEELKKFASRLASFGLGEETGCSRTASSAFPSGLRVPPCRGGRNRGSWQNQGPPE